MAINKVVYGGNTLIDLTADTVDAAHLKSGYTAHDKSGAVITGTDDTDSNTQDATVAVAEMLSGKTAYARGTKLTGTMPNNGGAGGVIDDVDDVFTIPQGYHDGSGSVAIDAVEQAKLIPGNIKNGIEILGVIGTYGGETVNVQSKTATPATTQQVITPDSGYDYLSQVTINAISYVETANAAGGLTVTIAG
jgi:hypothetical protein